MSHRPRTSTSGRQELRPLLHDHFLRRVRLSPDQPAIVGPTGSVTFRQLGRRVEDLGHDFRTRGIGRGALVGLHVERSAEWVASVLAILGVGGAVVPLPPSYPDGRLREILDFADFAAVVDARTTPLDQRVPATRLTLENLGEDDVGVLENLGEDDRGDLDPPPAGAADPDRPDDPDQPAFVLCSSGTTGRPKMIVRSHRSFFHRLRWTWERHPYRSGERCCQKSPATTTHAVYELFEPLLAGVPVVVVSDRVVRDLEKFWEMVHDSEVSRLLLVPSQLEASLAMPDFTPPSLRVLVLMGEYVTESLASRTLATFPESTSVYSIYGSTEASSTLVCDLRDSFRAGRELPLGEPIAPDIAVHVLDSRGRPTPPGEVGRLHVGGPALFSGYLGDPGVTASTHVTIADHPDPLYDTRDDVRRTSDGHLEFVGRTDRTVKIRGFRVDTREVEGVLQSEPSVREAVVVAVESTGGGRRLEAFVAPASVDPEDVYPILRNRLPEYMIPSRLVPLDAFPLTPGGKVDRRSLRERSTRTAADRRGPRPSLSRTEGEVVAVWERVLERTDLPPDASFFELGGTSLSAFRLVHRLRERLELDRRHLDVETVYRFPTVTELAAHVDRVRSGDGTAASEPDRIVVSLRSSRDPGRRPLFFVSPAGGTPGPYGKLARALDTPRELLGVRDPFHWDGRDPAEPFDRWVDRYLRAVRTRQPEGPYHLVAYSSAAPFGYEIARRLRSDGQDVPVLVLIDPLGMDSGGRSRYGWWVQKATTAGRPFRALVRILGRLRARPLSRIPGLRSVLGGDAEGPDAGHGLDVGRLMDEAVRHRFYILSLSALLELNTGLPFALDPEALDSVAPDRYLEVLGERVRSLVPDVDVAAIERVVRQYPLQLRAQETYRLGPYDGPLLLVEASSPYAGLVRAQLRPYVKVMRSRVLELGEPSDRVRKISVRWGRTASHFRSIRDDRFVTALARELDAVLD